MTEKTITVDFKIGIHSRPAALLVKKAREYNNVKITFIHNGKSTSANSLIGLLSLGVTEGSALTVQVEGADEEKVLEGIVDFFKKTVAAEA